MSLKNFMALANKREAEPQPSREVATVTPIDPERTSRYALKALTSECENVANAPEGQRNHTLNKAAFSIAQIVAAGHLDHDEAWENLAGAARVAGLPEHEITRTLTSGFNAGEKQPRTLPNLELEAPAVTVLSDLTDEQDDTLWASRPILSHLHTFSRARRVSPWAVLGVVLARIVTATPYTVCLPPIIGGRSSLNIFVGLVGPSGSGKGAAEAVARDAVLIDRHIEIHKTGSGEGIAHGYMQRVKGEVEWRDDDHAVLFSVPEIDAMAAQTDRRGATLMPELRSAWSGERLGFGYADPSRRLPVPEHMYRLALVAGIQPQRAGCLLDDADGGTPQRFLWLPSTDPDAPDVAPDEPAPAHWSPPMLRIRGIGSHPVKVCQGARDAVDAARLARLRGQGHALDGHAVLCRLKTAAALAILDGRYEVTEEDWRLAGVVQAKSDSVRARTADALRTRAAERNAAQGEAEGHRAVAVAERVTDAAVKRVCGVIIRRLRREGLQSQRDLKRAVAGRDRDYYQQALDRLLDAAQVVLVTTEAGDRYQLKEAA